MKCQKCNKNEANVQYRESVNGNTREILLCSDCAAESGLLNHTSEIFQSMEREMLSTFSFPFGRTLGRSLLGGSSRSVPFSPATEVGGFFENDPVESMNTVETAPEKKTKKPETVDELKAKLLDAIADERYEDAAKLRDKIKELKGE